MIHSLLFNLSDNDVVFPSLETEIDVETEILNPEFLNNESNSPPVIAF